MTAVGEAAYPLVADKATKLCARLTKRHTKPAWKWMISRALRPSRGREEEAAANTGGRNRWSQSVETHQW